MTIKRRAAAYVRVANDDDAAQRLAGQEQRIRRWAEGNACEIVQVFSDIGSGTSETRPGLQALMKAAQAGQLEVVILTNAARLFRDLSLLAQYRQQLVEEYHTDVIFLERGGGGS